VRLWSVRCTVVAVHLSGLIEGEEQMKSLDIIIILIISILLIIALWVTPCRPSNVSDICWGHWEVYVILNLPTQRVIAKFARGHNAPVYFVTPFSNNKNLWIIRLWICDETINHNEIDIPMELQPYD